MARLAVGEHFKTVLAGVSGEFHFLTFQGTFPEFARQRGLESVEILLDPGDLYFFNTRLIREVPGVDGPEPRVVLATFIGYSPGEEEIFVWS